MPFVEIQSRTQGKAKIHYEISTSFQASARCHIPTLPSVLFIHGEYNGAHIFHPQFDDRELRRFNLIALDLRIHGITEGAISGGYGQKDAAADVANFMEAIGLERAVLVGISMGTTVALQLAVDYPAKLDGLFLISPLGTEELEDVALGREQVRNTWLEAFASPRKGIDQTAIEDATFGSLQLAVNNADSPLVRALTRLDLKYALAQRRFRGRAVEDTNATIRLLNERTAHSIESLSRIKCPVRLVHCLESVAYDLKYTEVLFQQLKDASVDVSLVTATAPQMGTITRPDIFNPMLVDFVLHTTKTQVPTAPEAVESPFSRVLAEAGYSIDSSDAED